MTRILNREKGYIIQLNNLFISSKLLSILQNYNIRATSTIQTGQTKQEENKKNLNYQNWNKGELVKREGYSEFTTYIFKI